MRHWMRVTSGAALLGLITAGPAIGGHYGGKGHAGNYGTSAPGGKHAMHYRSGHPHCRSKMSAHRFKGHGHGPYKAPGWKSVGPRPFGHHGYTKHRGYGYGQPTMRPRSGTKPSSYGTTPKKAPRGQSNGAGKAIKSHPRNIVETAVGAEQFATLVSAVKAADLSETLSGAGPFTVFAPTDDAFQKLPEGTVSGLLDDPEALKSVLTYHVVQGRLTAADLLEKGTVETLGGGTLRLQQLKVAKADIPATNGVIHVVDEVLLPPES